MKLRVKGDSIRLRLTRAEVERLAAEGCVEEKVHVSPNASFSYQLRRAPSVGSLTATLQDHVIEVQIPEESARRWCNSDAVTLESVQRHGDVELRIVVEKDFACLAPRSGEDESDQFRHPRAKGSQS